MVAEGPKEKVSLGAEKTQVDTTWLSYPTCGRESVLTNLNDLGVICYRNRHGSLQKWPLAKTQRGTLHLAPKGHKGLLWRSLICFVLEDRTKAVSGGCSERDLGERRKQSWPDREVGLPGSAKPQLTMVSSEAGMALQTGPELG